MLSLKVLLSITFFSLILISAKSSSSEKYEASRVQIFCLVLQDSCWRTRSHKQTNKKKHIEGKQNVIWNYEENCTIYKHKQFNFCSCPYELLKLPLSYFA